MTTRRLAIATIVLWAFTAMAFAAWFTWRQGPPPDADRNIITVTHEERQFVLKEMRLIPL